MLLYASLAEPNWAPPYPFCGFPVAFQLPCSVCKFSPRHLHAGEGLGFNPGLGCMILLLVSAWSAESLCNTACLIGEALASKSPTGYFILILFQNFEVLPCVYWALLVLQLWLFKFAIFLLWGVVRWLPFLHLSNGFGTPALLLGPKAARTSRFCKNR